jgi:hypothetical protein
MFVMSVGLHTLACIVYTGKASPTVRVSRSAVRDFRVVGVANIEEYSGSGGPFMPSLIRIVCALSLTVAAPAGVAAQTAKITQEQREANSRAHAGDFDYLLGDWEFTAVSKDYGTFRGRWSAVRLAQGQFLDEYRVVDDKGETTYVTTTLRAYNALLDRLELVGMDEGDGLRDTGIAHRVGREIALEQTFGATRGAPKVARPARTSPGSMMEAVR